MKKRQTELLGFGIVTALMGLVGVASSDAALSYNVFNLGLVGSDSASTGPGINNSPNVEVVGQSAAATSQVAAYSLSGTKLQTFGNISGTDGAANAVNDGGIAVGFNTSSGTQLAVYTNVGGSISSSLPTFGGPSNFATAVNGNSATFSIVGQSQYAGASGALRAFSWISSNPSTLTALGPTTNDDGLGGIGVGATSQANGVNTAGLIVGYAQTTSAQHAFVYNPATSKMYDLGVDTTSGSGASVAAAINTSGEIVGTTDTNSSTRAFIYTGYNFSTTGGTSADTTLGNHFVDIGSLDGTTSSAAAVNTAGDVVGTSSAKAGSASHAFLYLPGGSMNDLNLANLIGLPAGWTLDSASGINNAGDIAGIADDGMSNYAFLLTPSAVPEPASIGAITAGAGLISLRRRRSVILAST